MSTEGKVNNGSLETKREPSPSKSTPTTMPKSRRSFGWLSAILVMVILAVVTSVVLLHRGREQRELEKITQKMTVPKVLVIYPQREQIEMKLVLPGNVQAFKESPIYAQVSGYVKRWLVDIGSAVKEGQLLAEIDTPEIDQQLKRSRALLVQTEATQRLAQSTADRWIELLKDNAVSQQETDEKKSALEVKKADLIAAQANVTMLEELQAFKKVVAPFDGVITARRLEVGNLINAGAGSADKELFRIAQINILRVYTNVPEVYSGSVTLGTRAKIEIAATPGKYIAGEVVRTAGSIDPTTNTMLVEVDVANKEGELLAGGYARVHLEISQKHPLLLIPANTLIFRTKGAQVGVVDLKTNRVRLVRIKIGRDFGSKLEVSDGLGEQDAVILNPSDSLSEGALVQMEARKVGEGKP